MFLVIPDGLIRIMLHYYGVMVYLVRLIVLVWFAILVLRGKKSIYCSLKNDFLWDEDYVMAMQEVSSLPC